MKSCWGLVIRWWTPSSACPSSLLAQSLLAGLHHLGLEVSDWTLSLLAKMFPFLHLERNCRHVC